MERNLQTDHQLDWPEIVASAKRRRHEMKLTQRRLAAISGVSLPTVVKFEAGQDVRLSSALAILKILDLVPRPVEGVLMIADIGSSATGPYQVMFAPYASRGGALEPRKLADRSELDAFLEEVRVGEEDKQRACTALTRESSADIVNLQLSPAELRRYWPLQFSTGQDGLEVGVTAFARESHSA
jgi:transcriptional regulator with XRE-family HTH domain